MYSFILIVFLEERGKGVWESIFGEKQEDSESKCKQGSVCVCLCVRDRHTLVHVCVSLSDRHTLLFLCDSGVCLFFRVV